MLKKLSAEIKQVKEAYMPPRICSIFYYPYKPFK
jgi:hypothetical protein